MLVPFEEMPKSARVWIYQADRPLSNDDQEVISTYAEQFLSQWAAHGNPLKNSFKLFHNQFLVIAVDESYNQASGCSIDASVGLVRKLQEVLGIDFFDRTRVCFMADDQLFNAPMNQLKELVQEGKLTSSTLTFNNLVQSIGDLDDKWLVPAEESWVKRYF